MDDRKMKIKIVVRPEDEQKAAAAAEARQARQTRARWGIAALIVLVALSAATALFFIGRGPAPSEREEPPLASAPGVAGSAADRRRPAEPGAEAAAGAGQEQGAAGTAGAGATAGGEAGAAVDEARSAQGEPALPPPVPGAPPAASADATASGIAKAPAAPPSAAPAPAPPAGLPEAAAPSALAGRPEAAKPSSSAGLPEASEPAPAGGGEAAKAPVLAKAPAAKPGAGVVRAELASNVVNREPKGALRSPVDVGAGGKTVFYFNEFRNLNGQTVAHRWEYNGRVVASIPLRIDGNRWRVYSSKRIGQNQLGDWRVSAVDRSGAVLAQTQFRAE
jgi:hypothetical protein